MALLEDWEQQHRQTVAALRDYRRVSTTPVGQGLTDELTKARDRAAAEIEKERDILQQIWSAAINISIPSYEKVYGAFPRPFGTLRPTTVQLPILKVPGGASFFFDARLSEFRDTTNPHRSFPLKSDEGQHLFAMFVNQQARRR